MTLIIICLGMPLFCLAVLGAAIVFPDAIQ